MEIKTEMHPNELEIWNQIELESLYQYPVPHQTDKQNYVACWKSEQ